jgi:hypothetical protein
MIMKKVLLSFSLIACTLFNKANAQSCTIIDVTTSDMHKITDVSGCYVTFDLTIKADLNGGNKGIWVHFWDASTYPSTAWDYKNSPSAAFLSQALGTLGVDNNNIPPTLVTNYPFDNSQPVVMATAGQPSVSNSGNIYSYVFTNVKLKLPSSCVIPTIKADVWSTQANSLGPNTKPSCSFAGRSFNVGDPTLAVTSPFKNCGNAATGRSLTFTISTNSVTPITVYYEIHKDDGKFVNGETVYESGLDLNVTTGGDANGTRSAQISASSPYVATNVNYFTGYNSPTESSNYWVVVRYTPPSGTTYNIANVTKNECASTLPVNFKSFTATNASSAVNLKWTTATEVNNKGFYVQRYYNGRWESIMFIASKAEGGNSNAELNYTYNDAFSFTGTVQYRILQVDIDGKAAYSQVRSISNAAKASEILVYPNPAASNSAVSIVLKNTNSFCDIEVIDNSGRMVKQFLSVRSTQQISHLSRGQYLARVIEKESGNVSVEKFIIQ